MNSNQSYQPSHWNRGYENFNEALHEFHHERNFTQASLNFPNITRKRKFSMKAKILLTIAASLLLSAPAWCDDWGTGVGAVKQVADAVDTTVYGVAGCVLVGGAGSVVGPKTAAVGCAVGGAGAAYLRGEAQAAEAPKEADLQNSDSEE